MDAIYLIGLASNPATSKQSEIFKHVFATYHASKAVDAIKKFLQDKYRVSF